MAGYVDPGGVRTWYDERGEGEPLVLLHGGSVDARFFDKNIGALADRFHVFLPKRLGPGHTPDVDGPITYQLMAKDTVAFLEAVVAVPRTWSATATARSWRCWSPCAVPTWPASWSSSAEAFTTTA